MSLEHMLFVASSHNPAPRAEYCPFQFCNRRSAPAFLTRFEESGGGRGNVDRRGTTP
jgi:hypothetical protein